MGMNLTPKELAERWHMSVNTLQNWRVLGTGPEFVRFGTKIIFYPLEKVEEFERKNLMKATTVKG